MFYECAPLVVQLPSNLYGTRPIFTIREGSIVVAGKPCGFGIKNQILNTDNWAVYDNEYLEKEGKLKPENTRRTYAIEVKDGFLNCLIDKDPKRNGWFMTGGIAHKKNYKYGKFEFRIRMDEDPHKSSSGLGLTWPKSEK